ncbi:kinesin-like protein KIF25 isoform X1 [Polypterus senegalus]|uniref:kinesin-like protein KIF25 isoform X1 n=1 Tax=Polypterus senegalus TaxID=55291 RepID=UPI001964C343|nr:kinesin-like protein KIF25 isoform X1 [Polypterus senegalus]
MPLCISPNEACVQRLHLLESKLRRKEERIAELETENALMHLKLSECYGKLERGNEEKSRLCQLYEEQKTCKRILMQAVSRLLEEIQILKQHVKDLYHTYVTFYEELQKKSQDFLTEVTAASESLKVHCFGQNGFYTRVPMLERALQDMKTQYENERQKRKILHNTLVELRGNIRVHCRVRPILPNDYEDTETLFRCGSISEKVIHAVNDDTIFVSSSRPGYPTVNKRIEFERVYSSEESQEVVFADVRPLITSLLDGYNVCIMAYGQTGSGKTYTMMGPPGEDNLNSEDPTEEGIIPKSAKELFKFISERETCHYSVEVSIVEIYNNEVFDLLAKDSDGTMRSIKRDVITMVNGRSSVPSLTYERVENVTEIMYFLNLGMQRRVKHPTLVHTDSSRSHLIVTLTVTMHGPTPRGMENEQESSYHNCSSIKNTEEYVQLSPPKPNIVLVPEHSKRMKMKLELVDLAGSECVAMSGVTGAALLETSFINRSLSALADVLGALAEQRPHIPYRNSKLTYLLQDSIGGDAKFLVLLCVSPSQKYIAESLQSLYFGCRARQVQKGQPKKKNANGSLKFR